MFRTILVYLITILLILLVPIDSSDAQLVENKSGFKRQILNFDKTNNVFGKLSFLDIKSKVSDDPEFPSWILHVWNPVLTRGSLGSWDDLSVNGPSVIFNGTNYQMWYSGYGRNTQKYQIGYATSNNGRSWDKHPENPVLTVGEPGSWDESSVLMPTVLYNGSIWEMWYTGKDRGSKYNIGYATSEDGINWVKYSGNPVLIPSLYPAWDSYRVDGPYVMLELGIYQMWYSNGTKIGYAESADGIHWMKYPKPVLEFFDGDEYCLPRDIRSPTVIHSGDYYLWAGSYQLCKGDAGSDYMVQSFSTDELAWSTPEIVSKPITAGWEPSVIYRYGGLLKQIWFHRLNEIFYAEDSQLLNTYLPLLTR